MIPCKYQQTLWFQPWFHFVVRNGFLSTGGPTTHTTCCSPKSTRGLVLRLGPELRVGGPCQGGEALEPGRTRGRGVGGVRGTPGEEKLTKARSFSWGGVAFCLLFNGKPKGTQHSVCFFLRGGGSCLCLFQGKTKRSATCVFFGGGFFFF